MWDHFENHDLFRSILLGDSGYPLRTWLMVPFNSPNNKMQEKFNGSLSKGRVKVEQTFGIWKKRWSINKTGYRLALANVPTTVLATCVFTT